jgi:hypothetical protein
VAAVKRLICALKSAPRGAALARKCWWAYPVASIPWPAKVPDRHPAWANGLRGFWPAPLR